MVTLLRDILPFDLFKQMIDEGFIRSQVHPQYPELVIFNYTEKAQFDRVWKSFCPSEIGGSTHPSIGEAD